MQVRILRRATAAEMQAIQTDDGSCYYWTDDMDRLVGNVYEAKRVRDDSVVVDNRRVPICVTEVVE